MLFSSMPRPVITSMTFLTASLFLFCASSAVASCVVTPKETVALSGTSRTLADAETVISATGSAAGTTPAAGVPQPVKLRIIAKQSAVQAAAVTVFFMLETSGIKY